MSTTTVLAVAPNRRPAALLELRNAHGWSPSIWSRLLRHLGESDAWWRDGPLLGLWHRIEALPPWQQTPLVLTFDTGVIPSGAFEEAADELNEFDRRVPAPNGHANHVAAVADLLRSRPETPFLGVYGTSVSENPFDPWDEDADRPGSGIPLDAFYILKRHHGRALGLVGIG